MFARLAQKMNEVKARGVDIFPLHIGDTHLLPPERARVAFEAIGPECYRYGPPAGAPELLEAIAHKLRTRNGMSWATAANVQVCDGATHALFAASRAVLDPDDEVLLPSPYWPLIQGIVRLCGAAPREVPFYQRLYADPHADPRALLEPHITDHTVAIYLITPNNPDGKVLTRAQLERIAELARDRDLWVLSDEVYEDYVYGEHDRLSIAALPGMAERTLTAFSFSKSHAMAGLRVGYVTGPAGVMATARKICNHTIYSVPLHVQHAALRALTQSDGFIAEAHKAHRASRDEAVATVKARFHPPEGASYLFLDLRPFQRPEDADCVPLLERALEAGVMLAPGEAFGEGFDGFARLCFTSVTRERLREAIARLNRVLGG